MIRNGGNGYHDQEMRLLLHSWRQADEEARSEAGLVGERGF